MEKNISMLERFLRVALGLVMLALAVSGPATAWGLIGIMPLITGAMGFCPIYQALGIDGAHMPRHHA